MEQELATKKFGNTTETISKELFNYRIKEIAKCKRDIVYFAENYFRIISLDKGLHIIKLFDVQKEFLRFLVDNNKVICVSGRQQGKCVFKDTLITVQNKKTHAIKSITIEKLYQNAYELQTPLCNLNNTSCAITDDLSDQITRKFISQRFTDNFEILTDNGWKDIVCIGKTVPYHIYMLQTTTHTLKCADTHIVFDKDMKQIFVKDLHVGDSIQTDSGIELVENIFDTGENDNMYDVQIHSDEHRYFTNGVLSHNSTIYCIYSLWLATFFSEKKIMILANKLSTALELHGRISMGWEYLPSWLKSGYTVYNKGELTFVNKSSIRAFSSSSDAARGFSCNCIICDEFAFLKRNLADKLFTSMYPTISSSKNGKFIIVSTPNGTDNLYYDIWQQANAKDKNKNLDGWRPFTMYWWQVPGHDEAWKKKQIAAIGEQRFAQEFNNEFLANASTKKLVPDDILEKYRIMISEFKTKGIKPKIQKILSETEDKVYTFEMWHEFDKTHTYVASGDIAEGVGGDDSVLYIWDITDLRNIIMCAKFNSNTVSLVEFAYICSKILPLYCNPYLFCERNGVSGGMLDSLKVTYKYPNIAPEGKNGEVGIYSHVSNKGKSCLWARDMMTTDGFGFTIYDKDLIDEMSTFVKKDTKGNYSVFTAAVGAHDDHIMAFIWMCYAVQKLIVEKYFVVCETFNSTLGEVYPRILQPLNAYTSNDIKTVSGNQMHKDFIDFKNESKAMFEKMMSAIEQEDANDIFKYTQPQQQTDDIYFGGSAFSEPTWNMPIYKKTGPIQPLNPNNIPPPFAII